MKILKLFFRGNKRELRAFLWFCQAHPDTRLVDMRPIEMT